MTLLAVVAAAAAFWVLVGPAVRGRLAEVPDKVVPSSMTTRLAGQLPWLGVAIVSVVGLLVGGLVGATFAFSLSMPMATAVKTWWHHRQRAAARSHAEESEVACRQLAALLRVGHVPAVALSLAAARSKILSLPAAAQMVGAKVPPVLRRLGQRPGHAAIAELGVAWEVSEATGASLSAALDSVIGRLVSRKALLRVVASELAAPRATGRLLAALPLVGIGLGYGFGGDPLGFLGGSALGQISLATGVGLGCVGLLWIEHIANGADRWR